MPAAHPAAADAAARPTTWGIGLLLVVTSLRTWTQFGLLALFPLLLVDDRGFSRAAGRLRGGRVLRGRRGRARSPARCSPTGWAAGACWCWSLPVATPLAALALLTERAVSTIAFALVGFVLLSSFSVTVMMGQEYLPGRLALAAGLMIGFGAIGSAAPGLALFGAIADTAGRDIALWCIAVLPAAGAARSPLLLPPRPAPRRRRA